MQARETQLLTLLAGQHQFVIPIFQRDYSWGADECERLFNCIFHAYSSANSTATRAPIPR